jgi:hypothetical protein
MLGLEVAVGYVAAWVWRKARRVGGELDRDVDAGLDAALERVHALVAAKLAGEPAFVQLEAQAGSDTRALAVAQRTQQRVVLALEDAAEADERFAQQLAGLIEAVRQAERTSGSAVPAAAVTASGTRSVAIGGNNSGSITTGDGVSDGPRP